MAGDIDQVARVAERAAKLLLKNGGETARAEETALRIARHFGYEAEILAFPTGLTIMLTGADGQTRTAIGRVSCRTVDLNAIEAVNAISRALAQDELSLDAAFRALHDLNAQKGMSIRASTLYAGGSSAMFAVMFGGGWFDLCAAAVCGALIQCAIQLMHRAAHLPGEAGLALSDLLGGFFAAAFAMLLTRAFEMGDANRIIVSTIMPLLPGLALTNAIRDAMRGDLISGMARTGEALTRAVVLAMGAGAGLIAWMALSGAGL